MTSLAFRRSAIALAIVALAGCSTWDRMTKKEQGTTVGATSGAVGGAAVGGPAGAVAGGAIGGVAGHEMAKSDSTSAASSSGSISTSGGNYASSSTPTHSSSGNTASTSSGTSANASTSGSTASTDTSRRKTSDNSVATNNAPSSGSKVQGTQTMPRDEYLRAVQQSLNDQGYDAGKVDGKWGAKTAAALKKFQGDHGLQANGQIDAQTISALGITQPVESGTMGSAPSTTVGATSSSEQTASANQGMASNQATAPANQGAATSSSRSSNTQ